MSSWTYLEGKFNGVTDKKTLQNGTNLATFDITEEARGTQEASTYSVTGFKGVATAAEKIAPGTSIVAKVKIDSRTYKDKNGADRRSTELKAFAIYIGTEQFESKPLTQSHTSAKTQPTNPMIPF